MTQTLATPQEREFLVELDDHYPLKPELIEQYQNQGFIKLKNVLSPGVLALRAGDHRASFPAQ